MERFLKRKAPDINWEEEIKYDPGLRKEIDSYHPNHKEKVRRKYLENGPCQPRTYIFPTTQIGEKDNPRRFQLEWFDKFGGWLEYNESKDRAYCFCCFLFREKKDAGYKAFIVEGWNGYHRNERLKMHVGNVGGAHYIAMKKCDDLLQRNQHIDVVLHKQSEASKRAHYIDVVLHKQSEAMFKSLIVVLVRQALNCLFVQLLLIHEIHFMILMWLINLAKLYPDDFSPRDLRDLRHHLDLYIADVREDNRFSNVHTISELSQRMVETRKNLCYPLVYRLLKLVLVLPIATATVERIFSGMKIVKTTLSSRMGDTHLSNRLICYVEKEEFKKVTNNDVVHRFMNMEGKGRRFDL